MRRALAATAGTAVGLVVLLGYRSSGTVRPSHVAVGLPPSTSTQAPSTTTPAGPSGSPTTAGTTTSPTTSSPAVGPTPPPAPSTTASNAGGSFTGDDVQYRYGDIQIEITTSGGKITKISIPQESATDPRSQSINSQAVPILTQEALSAQNLNFDVVSGATFTSDAFAQALQSAMGKVGG